MKTLDREALRGQREEARRIRTRRERRRALIKHALLILASFGMLYPLLWMVSSSFKPESEIFGNLSLLPSQIVLNNYADGWHALRVSFSTFYQNSFLIAILAVVADLMACSITAFAFARLDFRFKNLWFALMLGTLMLPYHVTLIP